MMHARTVAMAVTLAAAFFLAAPRSHAAKVLFSTRTGERVSLERLVKEVKNARVIVFGERHDNPDDHTGQRTLLQALKDEGVNIALGMEMFRADSQPTMDAWIGGTLSDEDFARAFASNWGVQFYPFYRDLLYYARQEGIPLVGLNIPHELSAKVNRQGFESLSPQERNELGNVSCDISEKYKELLARALGPKKAPPRQFTRFCEAQVLWDVSMASNAIRYLRTNPNRRLMIIAGTYHSWKHGIPEQIGRLSEMPVKVILPAQDFAFENYKLVADEADFVWRPE